MSLLIRHRALPVNELFTEMSRYEFISRADNQENGDFRKSWAFAADELTELDNTQRDIIKAVGFSLGSSDVAGQLSMLEVNAQLLDKHSDEAHELYLKKGKLYRTVGLLAGLFIAILLV